MFGLTARRIQKREAEVRIREMLNRVGLENRMQAKPHQLSGGEQQRVALARALAPRRSILLMDEPLSSLDDERKRAIASDLLRLQSELGFTLIYVTHDRARNRLASVASVPDARRKCRLAAKLHWARSYSAIHRRNVMVVPA